MNVLAPSSTTLRDLRSASVWACSRLRGGTLRLCCSPRMTASLPPHSTLARVPRLRRIASMARVPARLAAPLTNLRPASLARSSS